MIEDLDKKLCEKYPEIFRNRHEPVTKTPMGWGFECGDGWYELIDVLCRNIQHHVDWYSTAHPDKIEQPIASQVKEKFGGLRFYIDYHSDDVIQGMIQMAESMSYHICEECGNKGKLRNGNWMRTLCDQHAAKYDYMDTESSL
jgi:hypothetical protein